MTKYLRDFTLILVATIISISGCATKETIEKDTNSKVLNQNSEAKDIYAVNNSPMPPNAKLGECYAKVLVPPKYVTKQKKEIIKEAQTKISIIPATYKTIIEQVVAKPETTKLITIPATYKAISKKILIKPAYTTWKKGRGEIEKVDNSTGDISYLVKVPAKYKTITSKVINTPAITKEVKVPAVYKTVTKEVIDTPKKEIRTEVPAVYKTVQTKVKVAKSYLRWQEILCEANTTKDVISKLQSALKQKGYNISKVDGVFGAETKEAIRKYQKDNKLNEGALTLKTLKSLEL